MTLPNSKQYMIDLLTYVEGDQAQQLRQLIDSISIENFRKADRRYRSRANNSDLTKWSFFMMSRSDDRIMNMSSDAVKMLDIIAGFMDCHNRVTISVTLISKILECSRGKAKYVIDELIEFEVLSIIIPAKGRRSAIYEVDQDLVSYGVRPQSKPLICGLRPVISKIYLSNGDKETTLTYGELVEVEPMPKREKPNPETVVKFKKQTSHKTDKQMTPEELLEGLI